MKLLDFSTIAWAEARSLSQKDAIISQNLVSQNLASQNLVVQSSPGQIKQILRQSIHEALRTAKELESDACLVEVRAQLSALQAYCQMVGKTFVFVEESITCDRYELGGRYEDAATLFRGPSENASVAICVTRNGSLLYRNSSAWVIYKNAGDIDPAA